MQKEEYKPISFLKEMLINDKAVFSSLLIMKGVSMLTNYERETIITFNEAETDCEIYIRIQKYRS